jgi:uncharacterized repeat protein (TIGR03803 family)
MTRVSQHRRCITALALVAMFVTALIETPAAEAQTYTVVHSFRGADGSEPIAGLIGDSAGNVYGTTYNGGASNAGVVFKLNKAGETVLYEFKGGGRWVWPPSWSDPRLGRQSLRHDHVRWHIIGLCGRRLRSSVQAGYDRRRDGAA